MLPALPLECQVPEAPATLTGEAEKQQSWGQPRGPVSPTHRPSDPQLEGKLGSQLVT